MRDRGGDLLLQFDARCAAPERCIGTPHHGPLPRVPRGRRPGVVIAEVAISRGCFPHRRPGILDTSTNVAGTRADAARRQGSPWRPTRHQGAGSSKARIGSVTELSRAPVTPHRKRRKSRMPGTDAASLDRSPNRSRVLENDPRAGTARALEPSLRTRARCKARRPRPRIRPPCRRAPCSRRNAARES